MGSRQGAREEIDGHRFTPGGTGADDQCLPGIDFPDYTRVEKGDIPHIIPLRHHKMMGTENMRGTQVFQRMYGNIRPALFEHLPDFGGKEIRALHRLKGYLGQLIAAGIHGEHLYPDTGKGLDNLCPDALNLQERQPGLSAGEPYDFHAEFF
jgi:hypothetical protein